ncbi:hypothetical protein J6G99_04165 [bacterium]|nr:hypothetical protein [bacterium]
MNRINQNRVNNTNFCGIKPKSVEVKNMEEFLKKIIENILIRAEREVPEYGNFKLVTEKFKNFDKNLDVDEFWLEIGQPPKGTENYETKRFLKFVASKPNSDTSAEILIGSGSKKEILETLKKEGLTGKLKEYAQKLSYNLEDLN